MLFVVTWEIPSSNRDAVSERFMKTGGPPPEGVKMIGRWHTLGTGEGTLVCESGDPDAIANWIQQWSDLMKFQITPVIDDEGAAKMISG